jgi:hypothetical protein
VFRHLLFPFRLKLPLCFGIRCSHFGQSFPCVSASVVPISVKAFLVFRHPLFPFRSTLSFC